MLAAPREGKRAPEKGYVTMVEEALPPMRRKTDWDFAAARYIHAAQHERAALFVDKPGTLGVDHRGFRSALTAFASTVVE